MLLICVCFAAFVVCTHKNARIICFWKHSYFTALFVLPLLQALQENCSAQDLVNVGTLFFYFCLFCSFFLSFFKCSVKIWVNYVFPCDLHQLQLFPCSYISFFSIKLMFISSWLCTLSVHALIRFGWHGFLVTAILYLACVYVHVKTLVPCCFLLSSGSESGASDSFVIFWAFQQSHWDLVINQVSS